MDSSNNIKKQLEKSRKRKKWYRIMSFLIAIVVFCTTYSLILPAITLEQSKLEDYDTGQSAEVFSDDGTVPNAEENSIEELQSEEDSNASGEVEAQSESEDATQELSEADSASDADSVSSSALETQSDWERSISDVKLSGVWADDLLAIARSQLGYQESQEKTITNENGEIKGITRFGQWYGNPYGDWSAMFVCFCLNYAKIPNTVIPYDSDCVSWVKKLTQRKLYSEIGESFPKKGDIIFFDENRDGTPDRVGIAAEANRIINRLSTIEGDSSDSVRIVSYDMRDPRVLGFAALPENPENSKTEEAVVSEESKAEEVLLDERVAECISLIDVLPTSEEAEAHLDELDTAGDEQAYEAYYAELRRTVCGAYACYQSLEPELQEQVTNRDKLLAFAWLYEASVYATTAEVDITAVNSFSWYAGAIIIRNSSGGTIASCNIGESSFEYWTAVQVVEQDGQYVVQQVNSAETNKSATVVPANGFVLVYHTGNLGQTPSVSVGNYVTFSSDFWKTDHAYNNGQVYGTVTFSDSPVIKEPKNNSSKLSTVKGADTSDFIELNLYDYDSGINTNYNNNHIYPGFQQDKGQLSVGGLKSSNFGNNITNDLAAGISGVTGVSNGGLINTTNDKANKALVGAMNRQLINGYPETADGANLSYLFSNPVNSESINGLFQYNENTGEYWFNSRINHAQYSDNKFTLYNQILTPNFIWYPFGNFLPFDDIVKEAAQTNTIDRDYLVRISNTAAQKANGQNNEYKTLSNSLNTWIGLMDSACGSTNWTYQEALEKASYTGATYDDYSKLYSLDFDEPTDFYFGMDMKMNFMQPKGGMTGPKGDQRMVFNFSGDDDVWVFIDGKLVLDLSGIHRHIGGSIDFYTGEVTYRPYSSYTNAAVGAVHDTKTFRELGLDVGEDGRLKDYSTHEFHFYYMERGSGSSVCEINFNFPILRKNTLAVTKQLSVDDERVLPLLGNPDFTFQALKANESGDLFLNAGKPYDVYNSDNQTTPIRTGTVAEDGTFTLKAGETAIFRDIPENEGQYFVRELLDPSVFEQYGTISVDGNAISTDYDVTVGDVSFKGVDSPPQDISNSLTRFNFDNNVETNKLGSLSITKTLTKYSTSQDTRQFDFHVTVDGQDLPVGTDYTVGSESRTVETAGQISLARDETAVIPNILAGSAFTVQETSASSDGYVVSYKLNGVEQSGDQVSGVIQTASTAEVSVNNAEQGTSVELPVKKTLNSPDGEEHSYTIHLEQVTSPTDLTPVDSGITRDLPIQITTKPVEESFEIGYVQAELAPLPQTFYYQITEPKNTDDSETIYDQSVYVFEVTVEKRDGVLCAAVTNVWKDGTKSDDTTAAFTNQIIHYELPETGGSGTTAYVMGGTALMLSAAVLALYRRKKRRKGDSVSL